MFSHFLGRFKFWKWTQIYKNNLKIFDIWQQVWFQGPFCNRNNTSYYQQLDLSLWDVFSANYSIDPKVSVILFFGFDIGPKSK